LPWHRQRPGTGTVLRPSANGSELVSDLPGPIGGRARTGSLGPAIALWRVASAGAGGYPGQRRILRPPRLHAGRLRPGTLRRRAWPLGFARRSVLLGLAANDRRRQSRATRDGVS